MEKKSIKKNFIMNIILTVSSIIVPIITFPYASRILFPEGIGKVTFATSIITYFSLFVQLGIPTYGIKAVACVRDDIINLSKTVKSLVTINFFMCVIVYAIFLTSLLIVPRFINDQQLYLLLSITMITDSLGVEWLYKGLEKYTYITIRSVIFKIIAMCCIFLFVKDESDFLVYAFFTVFASVGSNICNFISLKKYVIKVKVKYEDVLVHIKPILVLFAMSIATTIYTNMDNVMIGIINSDKEVGYYGTAVTIRRALLMFVTSLGTVMLPRTSYYIENGMHNKFNELCGKAMHFVTIIAFPIMFFAMIVAEIGINIYAGEKFSPSSAILRVILPTIVLAGWSNITGIQMLIPLNKEKIVAISVISGAIVDFILNLILIPLYSSCGAAFSTVIAEVVVLAIQLFALGKERVYFLFRQRWKVYAIANIIPIAVCVLLLNVINFYAFIKLVILFIAYFSVYGLIMFILKDELVFEVVSIIREKFVHK